ncbi:transketolase [Flavobacteriaceae bacterium]|nr:transketolase [Flavobacteriaceae bacterium]
MNSLELAKFIRLNSIKMVYKSRGSHIGSALSYVDILAVLYSDILKYEPTNPSFEIRDRFILSKGHACSSLYACLALKGFYDIKKLDNYGKNDNILMNHVSHKVPGVEFSTGSLGHGLPFGIGIAKGLKLKHKKPPRVYVLLGDGELAEGSNFEALLFGSHHKLDNLILIIDYNDLQSLTTVEKTLNILPLDEKIKAFGWNFFEVDGHDHSVIHEVLLNIPSNGKPTVIVANTIKGKGVSFMENKVEWHYKSPNDEEYIQALNEINNEK